MSKRNETRYNEAQDAMREGADDGLAVMEAAFDASIDDREDDGIGAMGIAMKALANSRERES